jgi:hypothetical protein
MIFWDEYLDLYQGNMLPDYFPGVLDSVFRTVQLDVLKKEDAYTYIKRCRSFFNIPTDGYKKLSEIYFFYDMIDGVEDEIAKLLLSIKCEKVRTETMGQLALISPKFHFDGFVKKLQEVTGFGKRYESVLRLILCTSTIPEIDLSEHDSAKFLTKYRVRHPNIKINPPQSTNQNHIDITLSGPLTISEWRELRKKVDVYFEKKNNNTKFTKQRMPDDKVRDIVSVHENIGLYELVDSISENKSINVDNKQLARIKKRIQRVKKDKE